MIRVNNRTWLAVEFKIEDCWIGIFWRFKEVGYGSILGSVTEDLNIWICLIPCFPIHIIRSHKYV